MMDPAVKKNAGNDESPIVIYYFYDLTDTDYFCLNLERRFRESGHTRRIEFKNWNCYKRLPGEDGDIFIFDGITMTALVEKGYLHRLPEIIDTDDMFDWTIDKSKVRRKTYGVPLMICANALICRKEDDRNVRNLMELHEPVAIPMRTMLMYYYLQSFCNYQTDSEKIREVFEHLIELMGGREFLDKSSLDDYNGINRFKRGECRYFLGFTESLRLFDPGEYVVRFANFSDKEEDQMPLFMVDYASLGNHVREEKLLDCLDLLEIMADRRFVYDLCAQEGKPQYMLPAMKSVYPDLARLDPLYNRLYEMLLPEENGVFRYGARFYEEFYQNSDDFLKELKRQE
ncbi:MAG: hypothetical protein E7576_09635 [Ruminococcaceae bacterium]|nr:hypothetical protein [Oscillospiraceae bacterium]